MTIELSEYVINAIADAVVKKMQDNGVKTELNRVKTELAQEFAEWVAREIFSDTWDLNKDAFAEIACRKLAKLGIVEESGNNWVLNESDEDDMTIQFKISKHLYKCLKKRIELNVASELDRLVDKGTVIEQEPSCSPKPVITIDGIRYIAEEPRLKTVHKDGEVVIGGFREIV